MGEVSNRYNIASRANAGYTEPFFETVKESIVYEVEKGENLSTKEKGDNFVEWVSQTSENHSLNGSQNEIKRLQTHNGAVS